MSIKLPPVLQEIAEVISLDVAIKLAQARGGQRIAIPAKVYEGHWLVDILGMEDATALCKLFTYTSRVHLDVPFGPTSAAAIREARIAKMVEAGKTANEIAAANQITRRTVFYKKAKYKSGDNPQLPDLFDRLK